MEVMQKPGCQGCFYCSNPSMCPPLRGSEIRYENDDDRAFCERGRKPYGQPGAEGVRPIYSGSNNQGWGNRIGWYLTIAAIGEATERPMYTFWDNGNQRWGDYSETEINEIVEWPPVLHWIRDKDWRSLYLTSKPPVPGGEEIPAATVHAPRELMPELAYNGWKGWSSRYPEAHFPDPNVTMKEFLDAYQRVYFQLRPKVDLGNPPKLKYLVLHLRGFDKMNTLEKRKHTDHSLDTVKTKILPKISSDLPWVVIANTDALKRNGENAVRAAGKTLAKRLGPRKKSNTYKLLSDYFAMKYAAGVVLGMHKWSSFSTTAILAGDRPIIFQFPFDQSTDGGTEVDRWEKWVTKPLRNVFSINDVEMFNWAMSPKNNSAGVRYRNGEEPPWAPDPRLLKCFQADYESELNN